MKDWQRLARDLPKHAPLKSWARRGSINRITLQKMLVGDRQYANGPAARRMLGLLESLERGEWRWIITGPPHRDRSYRWEGYAPFEHRPGFQVSLTHSTPTLRLT